MEEFSKWYKKNLQALNSSKDDMMNKYNFFCASIEDFLDKST